MNKVVTFGEVMLRLMPPDYLRLSQATDLEMAFGGAEANVAVALAALGTNTSFVTRLPRNDLADLCLSELRGLGVDITNVVRGGSRMGIYFVEKGASQRPSTVLYDRGGSAIAEIEPDMLDWATILAGANAFHFSGITPALSEKAALAVKDGASFSKQQGITVSCDLNYRKKLWNREAAAKTMGELMEFTDLCIANEEDAETVFGIRASGANLTAGVIDPAKYSDVARQLTDRFGFRGVAITLRESYSASRNGWSGMFYTENTAFFSRRYEIEVVDRIGGGDAFAAGLLYATLNGKTAQETVEYAAALSCLKHSINGDYCRIKLGEVETLLAGDGSGRVQR